MRPLGRAWRTLATHLCFFVYIPLGAVLGLPAWLGLRLLIRRQDQARVGKRLLGRWYAFFTWLMRVSGVLEVEIVDREALRGGGRFIVANHPTLIDFVLLASVIPDADCLVKASLLAHPAMRWAVLMGGYIPNDRGQETLELCRRSLAAGNSLVVFPEGTRSVPGEALRFQRGAAQLALRSAKRLTLLAIDSTPSSLDKHGRWWLAPKDKVRMRIRPLGEMDMGAVLAARGGEAALAARELTAVLERRYNEERERGSFGS